MPERDPVRNALPRLVPLPEDDWDTRTHHLLAAVPRDAGGRVPNIFTTLVRHPELYEQFMPFGGQLLRRGRLSGRFRELLILRTSHNTGAPYEWGRHVPLAKAAGFTDTEIDRLAQGPEADGWTALERSLIRAADELNRDARLCDATWEVLTEHFDEAEMIEITMLVGQYHMVAFFLNSVGVELDPGFDGAGPAGRERD